MEAKIIHITTAKGPAECQLAAAKILAELMGDLRAKGLNPTVIDRQAGQENGTVLSATVQVAGSEVGRHLAPWLGTVQWIQKSPYRPSHGRKNWFVGIFELKQAANVVWKEEDISYQAVRSSGSGGQNVNKVSSAVRATHGPTGINVFAQDSRSQLQNKKLARERLIEKLETQLGKEQLSTAIQQWSQHHDLERGNPVKTLTGMDLKAKKADKSYKSTRTKLKQDLRKDWEL